MNIRIPCTRVIATCSALASALVLAACAHFSQDGGFDAVAQTAAPRVGQTALWKRTPEDQARAERDTAQLLARPLSADDAVRIAILNNGSLQAAFAELGIAEADVVQSGRLPNPRFTIRRSSAEGLNDVEETVTVSVLALLTAPYVHGIEKRRFAAVQASCAADIVQVAARARQAYVFALAARDTTHYRREVAAAAETGAELARRMREAGNWTPLDEARERSFHAEAALELDHARLAESLAREDLIESLGVDIEPDKLQLAERLPDVPPSIEGLELIERAALDERIDLKAMRANLAALAANLHLTRATPLRECPRRRPDTRPARAELGPLRDRVRGDLGSADFRYRCAARAQGRSPLRPGARAFRTGGDRSALGSARGLRAARAAHDIALRERDEVLPLRRVIAEQDRKRYDAGQISVFDLLAEARAQIAGASDYLQSVRDFWMARSALDAVRSGPAPQP